MKPCFQVLLCALSFAALSTSSAQAGDAKNGHAVFSRCAACHNDTKGGPNGIGPNLFGVVGRKAGSVPNFPYSPVLKSAGFVWTNQKLDPWIANPMKMLPGNHMTFAGITDAKQRGDAIAYLDTLK